MTRDEQIDLWRRVHYARFDRALDLYEASVYNKLRNMVNKKKKILLAAETIDDLEAQFAELAKELAVEVQHAAAVVGSSALDEAYNVMSLDGRAKNVNRVQLSVPQVKQTIKLGRIIEEMAKSYNHAIGKPLKRNDSIE